MIRYCNFARYGLLGGCEGGSLIALGLGKADSRAKILRWVYKP